MGLPVVLIRFAGCNLKCSWCDQADSQSKNAGDDYTQPQLLGQISTYEWGHFLLTGGEPLLQVDDSLVEMLLERSKAFSSYPGAPPVFIETNGTQPLCSALNKKWYEFHITCSPKTNLLDLDPLVRAKAHAVKFIVHGPPKYEYIKRVAGVYRMFTDNGTRIPPVYFQALHENGVYHHKAVIEWAKMFHELSGIWPYISVQAHKLIGIP